jgi:hypothetical protein
MQLTRSLAISLTFLATLCACDARSGSNSSVAAHGSGRPAAVSAAGPNFALNPATGRPFLVDANHSGQAATLNIVSVHWGRLVDVYDFDPATGKRSLKLADFLIGDDIASDGVHFRLEQRPVTQKVELTVLHTFGSPAFNTAFAQLEVGLHTFVPKSLDPSELPPFTAQPRNAALAITFDDVLDDGGNPGDPNYPGTVDVFTVRTVAGSQPLAPFEARVLPDPNHGALIGQRFHSTRVIVDMSVSPLESLASLLPVNSLGLPAATTVALADAGLRVPTQVNASAGQFQIVRNTGGAGVSFANNGPTDPTSPTLDVVRAFRSGGATAVTGDPFNGFLRDDIAPQVLAVLPAFVTSVQQPSGFGPGEFRLLVRFPIDECAVRPHVGDVITTGNHLVQIEHTNSHSIDVALVFGDPATLTTSVAEYATPWSPTLNIDPVCAVHFSPRVAGAPGVAVSPSASLRIAFSEPIDPTSVRPFDTLTLQRQQSASPLSLFVVGHIVPAVDVTMFDFVPELPLKHASGASEKYLVDVRDGGSGITDLAGNALAASLPQAGFTLDPAASAIDSGGIVLRFTSTDEDGDGKPEIRGQVLYDLAQGRLHARPVTHFSAQADSTEAVVAAMVPLNVPVQAPLVPFGSKVMSVWRYHDLGFGLRDDATHNIDVEGLAWQPFTNGLSTDSFAQFQMSLAHSKYLPDEQLSTGLLPNWPGSGLVGTFASNLVDPATDPLTIVHPKAKGYSIHPSDLFTSPLGDPRAPWPLNRNVSPSQFTYWTWRDTGKLALGGPNGIGADTGRLHQVTKSGLTSFYVSSRVPTIGLPLLTEFRTYSSTQASGANSFRIAIALNASAMPFFRAMSSGGILQSGQTKLVDPDNEVFATGGVAPGTGSFTPPRDNVFYYGQADFVVRVSRAHTAWFDTFQFGSYVAPVIDASSSDLPAGTQVSVAIRGATAIAPITSLAWRDARNLDAYGDSYTAAQHAALGHAPGLVFVPTFLNIPPAVTDGRWHASASEINGARFVQMRISFLANAETGASPSIDSLGLAFSQ